MNEETLFHAALARTNPVERSAFLDGACAGNPGLREAVEALLSAHEASGPFLDKSEATIDASPSHPKPESAPITGTVEYRSEARPDALIAGRYTLQEKIGEGGMGEVWVARQSEPIKRKVALKLIKPGMDSRAVLQRFDQERQALAMMDHPSIAKVLDAGLTPDGRPFFAMELVNGLPLNRFCDEARLNPRERLELFVTICQAVQHAHQKGIVHRDLKPANILITDGRRQARAQGDRLRRGQGDRGQAHRRVDGHAVRRHRRHAGVHEPGAGGILRRRYRHASRHLLAGRDPLRDAHGPAPIDARRLKKAAITEMIRIIQEEEPSKPSTRLSTDEALPSMAALRQVEPRRLMALLRGELDWVVMKCLEKHRERRYETASGLARDIQRYLSDEAVEARPPSAGYRLGKFLKRNKGPVLAASFVLLALVAGFIGTAWGLVRADRARQAEAVQRKIAVEQKNKAETSEALAKAQRIRAEEREQQAIDAVKKFRDAVANNPELMNNPALESLRKTLLKEPLAFFRSLRDRLQAERDTSTESLHRLAHAAHELAMLTDAIGDKTDAMRAYEEALAIWERLARENPAAIDFAAELAACHSDIGDLQKQTGQPERAMESYRKGLVIWERLVRENPDNKDFADGLAGKLNNIGLFQTETGQRERALESYGKSLPIFERLARENPKDTRFANELAIGHNNIGMLQRGMGQPKQASESYGKALTIQERLVRENPDSLDFAGKLAISHYNIGNLLRDTGQPERALESYGKALAIWERLRARTRASPSSPATWR